MMPRPLTDDQIAAALRAHLPVPHATLRVQIVAEVATTPQQRRLPSIFGRISDPDPMARRRMMLIVALVALAVSASAVAIAGALLREHRAPELSLDPPPDLPAFVRSTYDDMAKLGPMTITALRDGESKVRIYVDVSGAVRIDQFASTDAVEPTSYEILVGTRVAELTTMGSRRVWHEGTRDLGEDARVFVFAALGAARAEAAPGCEVAVSPGEEYSGIPARAWKYVGVEDVAGRPAHHVSCGSDLWIDIATRLTLKSQAAETGVVGATPRSRVIEVTSVEVGQPPSQLFALRPPEGVATISEQEYQEYECSLSTACSATPAPVTTPSPARAEPALDGGAIVAAALRAADELGAFEVLVERSSATAQGISDRIVADGSGRFRIESSDGFTETIELIGPGYHYMTDQLTDGTLRWRDRASTKNRTTPTYPLRVPTTCDAGWDVVGVDQVAGRVADHIRCKAPGSSEYWIDRATHLVVRVFGTLESAVSWEASEVVELRLGSSPPQLFELPPEASFRPPTSAGSPSAPTTDSGEVVLGWPDTSQNAPGKYSWDGSDCSSRFCVMGFMHNGNASGNLRFTIALSGGPETDPSAAAVTVAGHEASHRDISAGVEEWVVDVDGTTIAVRLETRPGTSPTELAEAHAIVASMRTEHRDTALGFRLVFRLSTDDWDSG